jgi:hypothetical protein
MLTGIYPENYKKKKLYQQKTARLVLIVEKNKKREKQRG